MENERIQGLIAAAVTPMHDDGALNLAAVGPLVEHLLAAGNRGLYVCGSTGGGVSMTDNERRQVTEAFVSAVGGRAKVVVQVGHNSLQAASALARHARDAGADVISATCPSYFKIDCVETLVESMALVALAAPELPFYYYHIPALTDVKLDMPQFLSLGAERIPNLAGIKYTEPLLHEYLDCVEFEGGKFDILWGLDEMLLGALATGAQGAIGSTYNIAAPLYYDIIDAFGQGDLVTARSLQSRANAMIRVMVRYPFHAALRVALELLGIDCGPCRLPQKNLSPQDKSELKDKLTGVGFFDFAHAATPAGSDVQLRSDSRANGLPATPHAAKSADEQRHERV